MRNLQEDLKWLEESQRRDLSDEYLSQQGCDTREAYQNYAPDFSYGITFVESDIAYEWLLRAIKAEKLLSKVAFDIIHNKGDNGAVFMGDGLEKEILKMEAQVEREKQGVN